MENQTQIQDYYRQSASNYVRYWLDSIQTPQRNDALLDGEIENIFSAFDLAAQYDLNGLLIRGVEGIYHYCENRGLYGQIQRQLVRAHQAAETEEDSKSLARNALYRGRIAMRSERFAEARELWNRGMTLARQIDDSPLICDFQTELGVLATESRQYNESEQYLQSALNLHFAH